MVRVPVTNSFGVNLGKVIVDARKNFLITHIYKQNFNLLILYKNTIINFNNE